MDPAMPSSPRRTTTNVCPRWFDFDSRHMVPERLFWRSILNSSISVVHWKSVAFVCPPFISDIAVFVLKRDVKFQLTNHLSTLFVFWGFWHDCELTIILVHGVNETCCLFVVTLKYAATDSRVSRWIGLTAPHKFRGPHYHSSLHDTHRRASPQCKQIQWFNSRSLQLKPSA